MKKEPKKIPLTDSPKSKIVKTFPLKPLPKNENMESDVSNNDDISIISLKRD